MSVSVPIYDGKIVVGVLRYVSSMSMVNALVKSNVVAVTIIAVVILLVATIVGRVMSSLILKPIRNLIRVTREITKGNLEAKATVYNNDEIGQLSKAINRMTDEIAQSYKTKNDFISSISHELRTPLTSINGWAETIEDSPEDVETTRVGMEIISRETKRMIRLVNDLLDFSKLQSHRIELELEPIWMNDFLESLYNQFLPRASQEEIALRLHLGNTDVMVMADENRLSQVFVNILDTPSSSSRRAYPEVVIQAHMLDDQVVMTIEDNGPGMSSEELVRVKEKFYKGVQQTERHRSRAIHRQRDRRPPQRDLSTSTASAASARKCLSCFRTKTPPPTKIPTILRARRCQMRTPTGIRCEDI